MNCMMRLMKKVSIRFKYAPDLEAKSGAMGFYYCLARGLVSSTQTEAIG